MTKMGSDDSYVASKIAALCFQNFKIAQIFKRAFIFETVAGESCRGRPDARGNLTPLRKSLASIWIISPGRTNRPSKIATRRPSPVFALRGIIAFESGELLFNTFSQFQVSRRYAAVNQLDKKKEEEQKLVLTAAAFSFFSGSLLLHFLWCVLSAEKRREEEDDGLKKQRNKSQGVF